MDVCRHAPGALTTPFRARDYVSGDVFTVGQCGACGLAVTAPVPDAAALGRYYPPKYYGTPASRRFPAVVERLQRALYARRASAVERLAGGPGRVLDVGSGRGFLLHEFRKRGWAVQGTELSDDGARYAREVLGIDVHVGDHDTWPWSDGAFDAASVWHVLEHSAEPRALVRELHRVLRPGGVLLVSVPNFASPEARLARDGWFHLDVPRHLVHFTPTSLSALLQEAGFSIRDTSYFAPEYDTFSFVQSALNSVPRLPRNLLYDILRSGSARLLGGGRSPFATAGTLALAAPLSAIAPLATIALGLMHRGSTVVVYATKTG